MAQHPGDCAIKNPIQPTSDQQPIAGFHAELQTMGHAQLASTNSAQPTECPSLPNLGFHDSRTVANPTAESGRATDHAQHTVPIKPHQSDEGRFVPTQKPNDNSAGKPVTSSGYNALDLDLRQANKSEVAPTYEQQSNANAIKPSDRTSAPASTYEALDLDVRKYHPYTPAPDEAPEQSALMNRIKNISAGKSTTPSSAPAPTTGTPQG